MTKSYLMGTKLVLAMDAIELNMSKILADIEWGKTTPEMGGNDPFSDGSLAPSVEKLAQNGVFSLLHRRLRS